MSMNLKTGDEIKVESEEYVLDMVYIQEFDDTCCLAKEQYMGIVLVNYDNIIQED